MTVWILKDNDSNTPKFEIYRCENIQDKFSFIGWRYELYKCEDKDVHLPTDKNPLFSFKGVKCRRITADNFVRDLIIGDSTEVDINVDKCSQYQVEMIEYISKYKDVDKYVKVIPFEKKGWFKTERWLKFKFNSFIPMETKEIKQFTISSFIIKEDIDKK